MRQILIAIFITVLPSVSGAATVTESSGIEFNSSNSGQVDFVTGAFVTIEFEDADFWADEDPSSTGPLYLFYFGEGRSPTDRIHALVEIDVCDDLSCGIRPGIWFDLDAGSPTVPRQVTPGLEDTSVEFDFEPDNELILRWSDPFASGDGRPQVTLTFTELRAPTVIPLPASIFFLVGAVGCFGALRRARRRSV